MHQGMVLRIEKSSIFDGPGLRTVVFLKGCPLRCLWCSTPESQSGGVQRAGDVVYGRQMSTEQVLDEVRKDEVFFFHSGGGMTLSGGEPLQQADFSAELLHEAQRIGIDTAMETSLYAPFSQVSKTLPLLDSLFVDVKLVDSEQHKYYCGVDNAPILANLRRLCEWEWPLRLTVRTPIVPGINDDDTSLNLLGAFCASLKKQPAVQLLPYHRLGVGTYAKLGLTYGLPHTPTPDSALMEHCRQIVGRYVEQVG